MKKLHRSPLRLNRAQRTWVILVHRRDRDRVARDRDVDRLADLDDLSQPPATEPNQGHHVVLFWSKEA